MKIIIEGCDGTGKTTLAKLYANAFNLDYAHCTATDPGDYYFYKNTLRKDNIVWDRHTIGELIYPYVFHRNAQISPLEAYDIINYAKEQDVKIIILTCSLDVIKQRLEERGNEHPDIVDNIAYIDSQFRYYGEINNLPIIDTTEMTIDQLLKLVK